MIVGCDEEEECSKCGKTVHMYSLMYGQCNTCFYKDVDDFDESKLPAVNGMRLWCANPYQSKEELHDEIDEIKRAAKK